MTCSLSRLKTHFRHCDLRGTVSAYIEAQGAPCAHVPIHEILENVDEVAGLGFEHANNAIDRIEEEEIAPALSGEVRTRFAPGTQRTLVRS